jgi:hypothetical protein
VNVDALERLGRGFCGGFQDGRRKNGSGLICPGSQGARMRHRTDGAIVTGRLRMYVSGLDRSCKEDEEDAQYA